MMLRWFKQNAEFDNEVKVRFADDFGRLQAGMYKEWEFNHDGRLALIIICDQLTRAFYRGRKEAFMFDHISLGIAKRLNSKQSEYKKYRLVERLFILLPFMHSENIEDCEMSVKLICENIEYAEQRHLDEVARQLIGLKKSAEQFVCILKAFGRFPHRNDAMGRKNTVEEVEYFRTGMLPIKETN
jgi:uncharacterized protein (DUF924 family)